jgi:hypothetical protein
MVSCISSLILKEVRRPVRGGAVGNSLDGVGPAGLADLLGRPVGYLQNRLQVHPVYLLALDPKSVELGGKVGHGRGAGHRGAHTVLVVLHDKEARAHPVLSPEAGEVGRLEEGPAVHRPVAEVELDDLAGLLVSQGVGDTHP